MKRKVLRNWPGGTGWCLGAAFTIFSDLLTLEIRIKVLESSNGYPGHFWNVIHRVFVD